MVVHSFGIRLNTGKTILAAAAVAAFCNVASAQSSATIYGVVDAGFVRETGGAAGGVTKLTSGVESGSRIGFRGVEDLGDGYNAHFTLESGFNLDTGVSGQGGTLFGRQAFVGLTAPKVGTLNLGRQYTPLFLAVNAIDPFFGFSLAGSANNIMSEGGIRMNNTVKFTTHDIGGFIGEVAYGFGEVAGDNMAGRNIGALLGYSNGPLNLRLAYHRQNNTPTATVAADSGRTIFLGGTYDLKVVKLHLAYAINKGLVTVNNAAVPNTESRDALAGISIPLGAGTVLANFVHKNDRSSLNRDANQFAIGYTYAFTKRTDFYTSYGRINNHAAPGQVGFYTVGNASDTGNGDTAYNFGVRHVF